MKIERQNCLISVVFVSNKQVLRKNKSAFCFQKLCVDMSVVSFEILFFWFLVNKDQGKENNYENHTEKTQRTFLIYGILVFLE